MIESIGLETVSPLPHISALVITEYDGTYFQTNLIGQTLKDFLDADDYGELRQAMNERDTSKSNFRMIVLRIKSMLSARGCKLKKSSAFMKVNLVQWTQSD